MNCQVGRGHIDQEADLGDLHKKKDRFFRCFGVNRISKSLGSFQVGGIFLQVEKIEAQFWSVLYSPSELIEMHGHQEQ